MSNLVWNALKLSPLLLSATLLANRTQAAERNELLTPNRVATTGQTTSSPNQRLAVFKSWLSLLNPASSFTGETADEVASSKNYSSNQPSPTAAVADQLGPSVMSQDRQARMRLLR